MQELQRKTRSAHKEEINPSVRNTSTTTVPVLLTVETTDARYIQEVVMYCLYTGYVNWSRILRSLRKHQVV